MTTTITHTTLSTTYTPSEIEKNFQDLVDKFGNIDGSDIVASAGITASQLAASKNEIHLQLTVPAARLSSGWPAGGNDALALCCLPGSNGDAAWTLTDMVWVCTDTGAGTAQFKLILGDYTTSAGSLTINSTIGTYTLSNAASNNDINAVQEIEGGSTSIAYTSEPQFFAIISNGSADSTTLSGTGTELQVTLRLIRDLQSA